MSYNRQFCINELIMNDMNTIDNDGGWYLSSILTDGFKGYNNYTDEEIMQEMTERDISYLNGDDDDFNGD